MTTLKQIQNNCKKATYLIEKKQIGKITLWEKIQLRIHLAGCSVCKIFQRQSILINRLAKDFFTRSSSPGPTLDESFKKDLQERIDAEIKKE